MYCRNCKRDISTESFQLHEAHCSRNITLCEICEEPVPLREKEEHYRAVHLPILCPLCGATVRKDAMDQHKEQYCPEQVVQCQYCAMGVKRGIFDAHVESCGSRTDVCDRCNRRVLLRDMQEHRKGTCPHGPESGGPSFSNRPHAAGDNSGERVKIDPAWLESVTAAIQGTDDDDDADAVLAHNVFLEEFGHTPDVMETDDMDEMRDGAREVQSASPPTVQREKYDRCCSEGQLAIDEALARQLQEDENALYHATVDRQEEGVSSKAQWTITPDEPKKAAPSERPTAVPQHGRGYQGRRRTLPTMTMPFASFSDFRTDPFFRHSELDWPFAGVHRNSDFRTDPFFGHGELNWPFAGVHRNSFFTSIHGGWGDRSSSFPPFSEGVASSSPRVTPVKQTQKQCSSHGAYYYVEEPDD